LVSITFSLEDRLFSALRRFPWVNWSEVAREKTMKREIFERFIAGELTEKDDEFCERTGWDPLDEMEVREEFIKELKEAENEPSGKPMTLEEFDRWCEEL